MMTYPLLLPINDDCMNMQWSPNGLYLAATMYSGRMHIYDISTQMRLPWTLFLKASHPLAGELISCVAWSPDSRLLAVGGQNALYLVQPMTGVVYHKVFMPPAYPQQIAALSWSPDSKHLAVLRANKRCYLYNCTNEKKLEVQPWVYYNSKYQDANGNTLGWIKTSGEANKRKVLLFLAQNNVLVFGRPQENEEVRCSKDKLPRKHTSAFFKRRMACVNVDHTQVVLYAYHQHTETMRKEKIYQPEERWLIAHKNEGRQYADDTSLVSWSSDGGHIATCFDDLPKRVYVFDTTTGATIQVFEQSHAVYRPYALAWGAKNLLAWGGTRYIHLYQF